MIIAPVPVQLRKPIRLIVTDLDGCFSPVGPDHIEGELITRLQYYARRAASDPAVPLLTFNTGRPQPYVECLVRLIHITVSAICEGGLVMYELPSHRIRIHPRFSTQDADRMWKLHELVRERRTVPQRYMIEPGKIAEVTLLPIAPTKAQDLVPDAQELVRAVGGDFRVDCLHTVLTLMPAAFDKGAGLEWLSLETEIPTDQMATIGDSDVDWRFMQRAAISWAPCTASEWLRQRATVASTQPPGLVLVEAFESIIAANRKLMN